MADSLGPSKQPPANSALVNPSLTALNVLSNKCLVELLVETMAQSSLQQPVSSVPQPAPPPKLVMSAFVVVPPPP
ncbi:hypothetical protein PQX77_009157, partial [Marasmius sp. AFHP31]